MLSKIRYIRVINNVNKDKMNMILGSFALCAWIYIAYEIKCPFSTKHVIPKDNDVTKCEINNSRSLEEMRNIIVAVSKDGLMLERVPYSDRTKDVCWVAIRQNYKAFEHVPCSLIDKKMCEYVVSKDGLLLKRIPYSDRTNDVCWVAMGQNYRAFEHVPCSLIDKKMCEYVVSKDGLLLERIQYIYITKHLCWIALRQNYKSFEYIPYHLKDIEMFEYVVTKNSDYIQHASGRLLTKELCKISMQRNIHNFRIVRGYMKAYDYEAYVDAIVKHNVLIDYLEDYDFHSVKNILNISDVDAAYIFIQSRIRNQNKNLQGNSVQNVKDVLWNDVLHYVPRDIVKQLDINKLKGLMLTGKQFMQYFPHIELFKVIDLESDHVYKVGHNEMNDNDNFLSHNKRMFVTLNPRDWVDILNCRRKKCGIGKVQFHSDGVVVIDGKSNVITNKLFLSDLEDFRC